MTDAQKTTLLHAMADAPELAGHVTARHDWTDA